MPCAIPLLLQSLRVKSWLFPFPVDPLDDVDELGREVVHLRGNVVNAAQEIVVEDNGGNSSSKSCRGGNQRFRDSGCDHSERCASFDSYVTEGLHDSPDCAEQSDEWRGRAGGGKKVDSSLQPGLSAVTACWRDRMMLSMPDRSYSGSCAGSIEF